MTLSVAWEPLSRLREDGIEDMAVEHWQESETHHAEIPFVPDWTWGLALERAGGFRAAALRQDGELVGYALFQVVKPLFFSQTLHAYNDALYVTPGARGHAGSLLIDWCEQELANEGVVQLSFAVRPLEGRHSSARLADLLLRRGYSLLETIYAKVLKRRSGEHAKGA